MESLEVLQHYQSIRGFDSATTDLARYCGFSIYGFTQTNSSRFVDSDDDWQVWNPTPQELILRLISAGLLPTKISPSDVLRRLASCNNNHDHLIEMEPLDSSSTTISSVSVPSRTPLLPMHSETGLPDSTVTEETATTFLPFTETQTVATLSKPHPLSQVHPATVDLDTTVVVGIDSSCSFSTSTPSAPTSVEPFSSRMPAPHDSNPNIVMETETSFLSTDIPSAHVLLKQNCLSSMKSNQVEGRESSCFTATPREATSSKKQKRPSLLRKRSSTLPSSSSVPSDGKPETPSRKSIQNVQSESVTLVSGSQTTTHNDSSTTHTHSNNNNTTKNLHSNNIHITNYHHYHQQNRRQRRWKMTRFVGRNTQNSRPPGVFWHPYWYHFAHFHPPAFSRMDGWSDWMVWPWWHWWRWPWGG
ncbi:hypothetical protein V5O48_014385 [Marasmius crinis-equi]|uniref:Uncharacterized protein n=1 Tax=Marasmius crinis-equi TaxID=585013 RepID=A0ABR3EXH2_9AGAR